MSIFLSVVLVLLVLLSLFLGLVILVQRPRADAGMGAAIGGGGMMESTFGAESSNVLTKATVWSTTIFFVVSFCLYLGYIHHHRTELRTNGALPTIEVPKPSEVPSAPTGQLSAPPADSSAQPAAAGAPITVTPAPAASETPAPATTPAAIAAPAESATPAPAAPAEGAK